VFGETEYVYSCYAFNNSSLGKKSVVKGSEAGEHSDFHLINSDFEKAIST